MMHLLHADSRALSDPNWLAQKGPFEDTYPVDFHSWTVSDQKSCRLILASHFSLGSVQPAGGPMLILQTIPSVVNGVIQGLKGSFFITLKANGWRDVHSSPRLSLLETAVPLHALLHDMQLSRTHTQTKKKHKELGHKCAWGESGVSDPRRMTNKRMNMDKLLSLLTVEGSFVWKQYCMAQTHSSAQQPSQSTFLETILWSNPGWPRICVTQKWHTYISIYTQYLPKRKATRRQDRQQQYIAVHVSGKCKYTHYHNNVNSETYCTYLSFVEIFHSRNWVAQCVTRGRNLFIQLCTETVGHIKIWHIAVAVYHWENHP